MEIGDREGGEGRMGKGKKDEQEEWGKSMSKKRVGKRKNRKMGGENRLGRKESTYKKREGEG